MRRLTRSLLLSAAILAAVCLAAGCSSSIKSAVASLTASRSPATSSRSVAPDTPTSAVTTPTPSPTVVTPTPTPTVTTPTPSPSVSVSVTTTTASPSVTVSGSPAASSGVAKNLLWLWILLGVLVLGGVIALIVRSAGHRSAAAADWRSRIIDAYAKGSALYDAMTVAETPGALAAADAAARWYDIQRRADDLAQTLYALREAAPDEDNRARVEDVLASLQAARSAMDAERSLGGADPQHAAAARGRLQSFEASLRALRTPDQL